MELVIFIVFQLMMEVQSYKSPTVKVSPDVIRESSSVKISCETPADVTVNQCYFSVNKERNIKLSSSCELELTGAEVLSWAAVKSPAKLPVSLDINCYYTILKQGINKPSSDSPPATVTVLDSLQKPIISVSDDDVQPTISCEIPLSVRADFICSLYTEDDDLLYQRVSQRSQSEERHFCLFHLSSSELFTPSVNSRQLTCVYSVKTEPKMRSPHSDTYTIKGLPQAKLRASASVISETDTVELSCENTKDLKMEMCYFNINGRETNTKLSSSCQLSLTGSQISIWSGDQSSSVTITCFYTVMKGQVNKPSDHSDPVTITLQTLTVTSTSETTTYSKTADQSKTNLPTSTTKETMISMSTSTLPGKNRISEHNTLFVVPVSTGVAVIMLGLICLCWCASKKRRKQTIKPDVHSQEPGMSCPGPGETYSLITSVPATSQPISGGLKHPESHQDSTTNPTNTRSAITSINLIYQSSDALVNKKQKWGNTEENVNVNHLYATVSRKPVKSNSEDQV
ncbi:uncharacterized protein LOC127173423 isoform X1 [Labeo rohita]|uniref:uncharacterized protein LOC127173423 isoform X1 n=1 Tax=Labeo rohita TaxID=84645 RepID=UPI0021E26FAA|nr:uncharacterized protein LOC127173423 isoform X1 [Labeo rohita]